MLTHTRRWFVLAGFGLCAGLSVSHVSGQSPSFDWPMHDHNLRNSRYAAIDQINTTNVDKLALAWSVQPSGNIGSETPLVVDGVMYANAGSRLFAFNAATGQALWTFQSPTPFNGGGRGPAYGDGRIYAFGQSVVYAVDAKTGKAVESFGEQGVLRIVNKALDFRSPGKYPADLNPTTLGYSLNNPPVYANGTLLVGVPFSDSLVEGGLVIAVDGRSGAIKWVFNTIPQRPTDDGWAIAKDTWSGERRYGGGIWTPPAIDADLGLVFLNVANPSPNYDGSSRKGINLFTNSLVALNLATGKLVWHFQVLHHDIWDWDISAGPLLFDGVSNGTAVKGVAVFGKNCQAYFFHRDTGRPINPIIESVVPTTTDVPNEQVWPTQPMPYTASGVPQQPFCSTLPTPTDPALAPRVRPTMYPYQANEFVITAPGNLGGANYGGPSFSARTNFVYVTGKNDAFSIKVKPVGDTLRPGPGNLGHFSVIADRGTTGVTASTTISAYDPLTGRQAWQTLVAGSTGTGSVATAGDLVFQAVDTNFYAFDARSGKQLFTHVGTAGIRASPLTFVTGGKQYVSIVAGNTILTFALPSAR